MSEFPSLPHQFHTEKEAAMKAMRCLAAFVISALLLSACSSFSVAPCSEYVHIYRHGGRWLTCATEEVRP